jgi:hypothetical protein
MRQRLRKLNESSSLGECAICMDPMDSHQALLPCDHQQFCLGCILNWARFSNKCPLCKARFSIITDLATSDIVWVSLDDSQSESEEIDDLLCELCGMGDDEENMIICDCCERGFHTGCLGMQRVPEVEKWFCLECLRSQAESVRRRQREVEGLAAIVPRKRMREVD